MKKNNLVAFEAKETKLKNITGGGHFDGTYDTAGTTRIDSQYLTSKGDTFNGGSVATYDQYDGDICMYK